MTAPQPPVRPRTCSRWATGRLGVVSFGLARSRVLGMADETAQQAATYAVTRHRLAGYRDAIVRAGTNWSTVAVAGHPPAPSKTAPPWPPHS